MQIEISKEKLIEVLDFLKSYQKMKSQLALFNESMRYYNSATLNDEIESMSVSHPAESENIGAGRNISVSEKTANIALSISDICENKTKERDILQDKIDRLKWKINLIEKYCDSLPTSKRTIFRYKFIDEDTYSNEEIAQRLSAETKRAVTGRTISNILNKVIKEFAETYNELDI